MPTALQPELWRSSRALMIGGGIGQITLPADRICFLVSMIDGDWGMRLGYWSAVASEGSFAGVVAFRHSPGDSISQKLSSNVDRISEAEIGLKFPYVPAKATDDTTPEKLPLDSKLTVPPVKSSRVHVGRHEMIGPWPRPNPLEVAVTHALLQWVQQEQRCSLQSTEIIVSTKNLN
ncbi:hypothetical protein O6H91_09G087200 [Diphasiastrum complanatum]|uniref:Uncharacterized protein n=1 Tax=Diphasiastrum complanatum TaxID=34168 RepID=A0ACC2CRI5_DIPCM|nr:hypothetical protein O6H91_09G087200 [Diphasiastrum complanatum]